MDLELLLLARLAGQRAPGILLSLPPSAHITGGPAVYEDGKKIRASRFTQQAIILAWTGVLLATL